MLVMAEPCHNSQGLVPGSLSIGTWQQATRWVALDPESIYTEEKATLYIAGHRK